MTDNFECAVFAAPHEELSMTAVNNALRSGNGISDVIQLVLSHFTFQMAEKIGLEITRTVYP